MSALAPTNDSSDPPEIVKVLFALHPSFDLLDFTGPFEILANARHKPKDPSTEAFDLTIAAGSQTPQSAQGVSVSAHISLKEAHERLSEFDVLVIPGGGSADVIKNEAEPIGLIKAFVELQQRDPARERTVMSICTGSLFLAQAGALQGLAATTHPDYYITLEKLCQNASAFTASERTDVMEDRYIVNNARFELGDVDENPFIVSKEEYKLSRKDRRKSNARKGSNAWKESNNRRESNARRATLRLGGLRVITSGGVTAGLDASLYLVSAMVSVDCAEEVARVLQYTWQKGVVVDSIDV